VGRPAPPGPGEGGGGHPAGIAVGPGHRAGGAAVHPPPPRALTRVAAVAGAAAAVITCRVFLTGPRAATGPGTTKDTVAPRPRDDHATGLRRPGGRVKR